jgi:hypothetical protein
VIGLQEPTALPYAEAFCGLIARLYSLLFL